MTATKIIEIITIIVQTDRRTWYNINDGGDSY